MTVSDFYNRIFTPWLESQVATGQKSYATLVSYRRYWKSYVADHFNGTKTLRNYEPYQGLQFLQNLRKDDDTPLGQNTMKHIHSTASGIFSYATTNGFCEHNPWRDVPVGHAPAIAAEQGAAYDQKTVEMMIANLEAERAATPDGRKDWSIQLAQGVLAVGIFAGLRPSEIAGLQWQSVDFENRTITVRQAYVYGKEKATTKTGKERVVPFRDPGANRMAKV